MKWTGSGEWGEGQARRLPCDDMLGVVCRVGASPAPKKAKSPPFVLKLQPVKMPILAPIATWMPAPPAWYRRAEGAAVKYKPPVYAGSMRYATSMLDSGLMMTYIVV